MRLRPVDSEYKRVLSPSLGLLTLGALTPDRHGVVIADENVEKLHTDDDPDLVGISTTVDTAHRAYEISEAYRRRGIPVVLGGIHASACPDEASRFADAICIGEAEYVWNDILRDAERHALQKKYQSTRFTDPKDIPFPRWELIDRTKYLYTNVMYASRNCPFRCAFCYNSCSYAGPYRARPIPHLLKEIEALGTKHVLFIDDNFIGNIQWTKQFLQAIEPLGLTWNAAVSANIVHHENVLDQMAHTGCKSLFIGFESIHAASLASVDKHQNDIRLYERLVTALHSRGIMINASLVFGLDHDTPQTFRETLEWLVQHKVSTVTSHILTPYPGTRLFHEMESAHRIVNHDWRDYTTSEVVFQPARMSPKELRDGYLWFYHTYYSFRNILRRIPDTRSQRIPYLLFNFAYRKFGHFTSRIGRWGCMSWLGRLGRRLAYNIG